MREESGEKGENLSKMSWMGEALIPIQGRKKRIVCQREEEKDREEKER